MVIYNFTACRAADGRSIIFNIIPEIGNLVDVGSYEAYVMDHKDPNRYLPLIIGTYKSPIY